MSPKNSQIGGNVSEVEKTQKKILKTTSKASLGGLVLLEKVNENLKSLLKAFKG